MLTTQFQMSETLKVKQSNALVTLIFGKNKISALKISVNGSMQLTLQKETSTIVAHRCLILNLTKPFCFIILYGSIKRNLTFRIQF